MRLLKTGAKIAGLASWTTLGACASSAAFDAAVMTQPEVQASPFELGRHFTVIDVPLTIHYATVEGQPVVSHAEMQRSLIRANQSLATFGIRLYVRAFELLPEGFAKVTQSEERVRLAQLAQQNGSVHVFFVDRVTLFNARRTDGRVSGMHWRYHGFTTDLRRREYVVISSDAPDTTLVHEVGHAFGLPHEREPENLMCSCRRTEEPEFSKVQGRKMRTGARMFLLRSR